MNITQQVSYNTLEISFPFALKDIFRSIFRTEDWNPRRKVWEVKNNNVNLNKLDLFREKAADTLEVLAKLDEQELTDAEIKKFEIAIEEFDKSLLSKLKSQPALDAKLEKLNKLKVKYASVEADAKAAHEKKEKSKQEFVDRIDELMAPFDVKSKLSELTIIRNGRITSANRSKFEQLQFDLMHAYRKIRKTSGIEINTLGMV